MATYRTVEATATVHPYVYRANAVTTRHAVKATAAVRPCVYRANAIATHVRPCAYSTNAVVRANVFRANAEVVTRIQSGVYPTYEGEIFFTPSQSEQIIPVGHKVTLNNITIAPIPNNYGLITWNGATLTVS